MSSTEVLDGMAMSAARARLATAPDGPAALGALGDLAIWAAGVQGRCPPRPFANPVLVVVAADHGIGADLTGPEAPDSTAVSVARLRAGGGTAGLLNPPHLHVLDIGVDSDDTTDAALRVRRGSGRIDTEDALTADEALRAFAGGRLVVDQLVDSGADLLLLGNVGVAAAVPASVLAAAVTGTEPIAVVAAASGNNQLWMRTVTVVRDALHRSALGDQQPLPLLARVGGADIAAATGLLVQAAQRRTPVLLDGPVAMVASLLAEIYAGGSSAWWQAASRGQHPAQALALRTLDLTPVLDMGLAATDGAGALLALPLLQAAINLLDGLAEAPNPLIAAWSAHDIGEVSPALSDLSHLSDVSDVSEVGDVRATGDNEDNGPGASGGSGGSWTAPAQEPLPLPLPLPQPSLLTPAVPEEVWPGALEVPADERVLAHSSDGDGALGDDAAGAHPGPELPLVD